MFFLNLNQLTSLGILRSHLFSERDGAPWRSRCCDGWGGEQGTCFALSSSLVRRAGCCFRSPAAAVKRVSMGWHQWWLNPPMFVFVGKRVMILIWYWAVNLGFIYFLGKAQLSDIDDPMILWHHFEFQMCFDRSLIGLFAARSTAWWSLDLCWVVIALGLFHWTISEPNNDLLKNDHEKGQHSSGNGSTLLNPLHTPPKKWLVHDP